MNFIEEVARKKLGKGPDWLMVGWECLGATSDLIVRGGVPARTYKRGPRKGRPKFAPPYDHVVVTRAEEDAAHNAYEATTGKCFECEGSGEEWAGWAEDAGNKYRACRRCRASGIASTQPEPAK